MADVEPGEAAAAAARARRHIERPLELVADQLGLLATGGRIICCVPDCAPALEHGDLSMPVVEHWSYSEARTLIHLGAAAGARTVTWRYATTEG